MESVACIFCRAEARGDHREHVLPDSLGGDFWGTLPIGLVCKACNGYFGSKVEHRALSSFPFSLWRVFFGVPTKKGKPAHFDVIQGRVYGTGIGGQFSIDPANEHMAQGIERGTITRMTVIAEVTEPAAVCQLLLKMALETIALNDPTSARSSRYDPARRIARFPKVGDEWPFFLKADNDGFMDFIKRGPTFVEAVASIEFDVSEVMGGDFAHLRLPGFDLICPVEPMSVDETLRAQADHSNQLYAVRFGPRSRSV